MDNRRTRAGTNQKEVTPMTTETFFRTFTADTTAGSANQVLARFPAPVTRTGRVSYRLTRGGERYALLFANRIDSTFADGAISKANDAGGLWEIRAMRIGLAKEPGMPAGACQTVTFDGRPNRIVQAGEGFFCSDPVTLRAAPGDCLVYEVTVRGNDFPYHEEMVLNVHSGEHEPLPLDKRIPVPLMVGCDRPARKKIGFLGDSITQGIGTPCESYAHWVAKAAEALPDDVSVWNLGIGFGRASDAATNGLWLARAKTCDIVTVCFGVNDILRGRTAEEVLCDLITIVMALHEAGTRVLLLTIPPFDMEHDHQAHWYAANDAIRSGMVPADRILNVAPILGRSQPFSHRASFGGHPNVEGSLHLGHAAARYLNQMLIE